MSRSRRSRGRTGRWDLTLMSSRNAGRASVLWLLLRVVDAFTTSYLPPDMWLDPSTHVAPKGELVQSGDTLGHSGSQKGAKWRPWVPLHGKLHIRNFHHTESFKKKQRFLTRDFKHLFVCRCILGIMRNLWGRRERITLSAPEECNQVECDQQLCTEPVARLFLRTEPGPTGLYSWLTSGIWHAQRGIITL